MIWDVPRLMAIELFDTTRQIRKRGTVTLHVFASTRDQTRTQYRNPRKAQYMSI